MRWIPTDGLSKISTCGSQPSCRTVPPKPAPKCKRGPTGTFSARESRPDPTHSLTYTQS